MYDILHKLYTKYNLQFFELFYSQVLPHENCGRQYRLTKQTFSSVGAKHMELLGVILFSYIQFKILNQKTCYLYK